MACRTCHSSAAFSHAVHSPEDRTRQLPRIIRRRTKVPRFQNRPRVGRGSWIAASSREKAARIFGGRPCRSDAWLSCAGSDELAPEVGNSDAFSFQVQNGPGLRGPYGPGPLGAGEVSVPNHSLDGAIVAKVCGGGEKVLEPNWVSFPGSLEDRTSSERFGHQNGRELGPPRPRWSDWLKVVDHGSRQVHVTSSRIA